MLFLALPLTAAAADISFKLEPDVAIPLTAPQSERFGVGGGESLKLLFGLTPWLDIGPAASFHLLPGAEAGADTGVVWALGGGIRVKRRHDAEGLGGLSPWLDADAFYIRTGALDRPGFDAAVGLSIPVGETRAFWVGPFVRYLHVGQPETRADFDNRDAKFLTLGISLEAGSGVKRKEMPVAPTVVTETVIAPCPACPEAVSCTDIDNDGVPDTVDRCPDVIGTLDDYGCPTYKKVVVKKDKLELNEKLYFAWDEATLEAGSFPILDEVAQALKDNKGFRVQVEGHTDSTGSNDHNQSLSEARAKAVLDYLVSHGIAADRVSSKGFSSSVPIDTNATVAGRENNRRVEFVVAFILLNDGSAK
ncbi:MAG: OmpA family protein [Pseudomonadota bacterium]|nr:OmpA family protein [Pseudomonadota bacterium]